MTYQEFLEFNNRNKENNVKKVSINIVNYKENYCDIGYQITINALVIDIRNGNVYLSNHSYVKYWKGFSNKVYLTKEIVATLNELNYKIQPKLDLSFKTITYDKIQAFLFQQKTANFSSGIIMKFIVNKK